MTKRQALHFAHALAARRLSEPWDGNSLIYAETAQPLVKING